MGKKPYKPGPVPKEAVDFFRAKGWKVGFDYRDVWAEEHAFAFTAAKAMTVDVLETLRGGVDRALAEGRTFQQFKKELQPELERLGWWGKQEVPDPKDGRSKPAQLGSPRRLKIIYQTNMRTARAAGKWERIQRTKTALPFLKYSLGPAEKHRPEHVSWAGTILPADDEWWDAHMPPNGWNCKCWVQQLTRGAVDRSGGLSRRPDEGETEYINPRTGERMRVPRGVTPGFNYNAGKVRLEKNLERFKETLNGVSADAADAVQRAWMQPEIFGRWRDDPKGNVPVAVMDEETRPLMGAKQKTIYLSAETMVKQLKRHPDLEPEEYCLLPDVIRGGDIFRQDAQRLIFFETDRRLYRATVKTTEDGRENFAVNFQRVRDRDYRKAEREFELIRRKEK